MFSLEIKFVDGQEEPPLIMHYKCAFLYDRYQNRTIETCYSFPIKFAPKIKQLQISTMQACLDFASWEMSCFSYWISKEYYTLPHKHKQQKTVSLNFRTHHFSDNIKSADDPELSMPNWSK